MYLYLLLILHLRNIETGPFTSWISQAFSSFPFRAAWPWEKQNQNKPKPCRLHVGCRRFPCSPCTLCSAGCAPCSLLLQVLWAQAQLLLHPHHEFIPSKGVHKVPELLLVLACFVLLLKRLVENMIMFFPSLCLIHQPLWSEMDRVVQSSVTFPSIQYVQMNLTF